MPNSLTLDNRWLTLFRPTRIFLWALPLLTGGPDHNKRFVMSLATPRTPRHIVVIGAGIQGTAVAYELAEKTEPSAVSITLLEAIHPASAASGKGGGFMARTWGDGTPTQRLHELAFDMYSTIAPTLQCQSYRKIPVLSVSPQYDGISAARKQYPDLMPGWLDGKAGRIAPLGYGEDTAQVSPAEYVEKMLERHKTRIRVVTGVCVGVETDQGSERGSRKVTSVQYSSTEKEEASTLPADVVVVAAGPWSCAAEDWFHGAVCLPMEGIKSTSIVWKQPESLSSVDAVALFCGPDSRYGTNLEVYPRPNGDIYICGIGGSDYISTSDLKNGAFRGVCEANPIRVEAASKSFKDMSTTYKNNGELKSVQACMRPCPPDALPYMGRIPGYEGAYINAGHNCWGIAWAPACGRAMAELILEGHSSSIDLSAFDPSRFSPDSRRGTRGRKKQGQDIGEQW